MSSTYRDPLPDSLVADRLSETAPGGRSPRRRERTTWVAAVGSVVAVLALVIGATILLRGVDPGAAPIDAPAKALHLPTQVNAPGTWSDNEGPERPLAALGVALRTRPVGLTGERQRFELFGVSAVDGRAVWLDLPGANIDYQGLVGWFALSPDGRWVAWARQRPPRIPGDHAPLLGWSVMETTTGEVRQLSVPSHPRLRPTMSDLAFSGDSRYLLISYETPGAPQKRGHQFVAWDLEDGTPTVLEEPGHYWLPNLGSAPSGVVWSRSESVYRDDPATGERTSYSLPRTVITASWAPNDTAFAYIGRPNDGSRGPMRLYAGRSLGDARDRALPLPVQPNQLLGWRDSRHVVVGHHRSTVHVVDVVTGEVEELDLAGSGETINAPLLAADLWRNPLAAPVAPTGTSDPRAPLRWGGGALVALLAAGLLLRPRRARPGN